MSVSKRTKIATLCFILILVLLSSFFYWQHKHQTAITPSGGPGVAPRHCAPGYVDYGVPLGCIPKQQYDQCLQTHQCPICLSSGTDIDTDRGWRRVTDLQSGDMVWSMDHGQKVLVPVLKLTSRLVPSGVQLLQVRLKDGRGVLVSPNHPLANGTLFKDLRLGDVLDGSRIVNMRPISYNDGATYDLLPASDTGTYWANGILVGSTLKQ